MRQSTTAWLALVVAAALSGLGLAACSKAETAKADPAKAAMPAIATARSRYLPEYAANGDLLLPKNFEKWVFVGSPFTPNALNGGKANFPEVHNVYIEPAPYELYKKTGVFPEGTIFFKELQLTLPPATHPRWISRPAVRARLFPRQAQCAYCHEASAQKDSIWVQFYPRLQ